MYDNPGAIGTWALAEAKDEKTTSRRREKQELKAEAIVFDLLWLVNQSPIVLHI